MINRKHNRRRYKATKPRNHFVGQYRRTNKTKRRKIIGLVIVFFIIIGGTIGGIRFHQNVTKELPDVSQVENMIFSQASVITDRNDEVLYRLFDENREYVPLGDISENMINAIIALEDQRYREHSGLDPIGIVRAAIRNVLHPNRRVHGASTIPQQLVKQLLLTNDVRLDRKLKEIVLTRKLDDVLEKQIRQEQGNLPDNQLHTAMKEEVLELYLNYIFFGNHAYGIEAAAQTYFGHSADQLNVLESAVLASIPKGPSLYNPYTNKSLVMGSITLSVRGSEIPFSGATQETLLDDIISTLQQMQLDNSRDNSNFVGFMNGSQSLSVSTNGNTYTVSYKPGRKDQALTRMYEDGYITDAQLKTAFIDGLDFTFERHAFEIKAPHFVQWVIELLEEDYDMETLQQGGLTIKTTLDYDIQQLAETAIKNNYDKVTSMGGNNNAMLYTDTTNGDVLAYVGSVDYFNEEIEGQNDMVQRKRQVGSTMKPLTYALGFQELPLSADTPMYDIPFEVGGDTPGNADGEFLGLLPLREALAASRNIPAIKMVLAAGGEKVAKPFYQSLGMVSLLDNHEYGYPITLGAGEVPMIELTTAYSHLTNNGKPAEIYPIQEIRSKDGSLLFQKEISYRDAVIPRGIVSLIWDILSDFTNMPQGRAGLFNVNGLTFGLKSGTSNAKTERGNRARDGWLVAYTPSRVMTFRAGNADGTPLYANAYGGSMNAGAMKEFMRQLLANNYLTNQIMPDVETTNITINKINGKIASSDTPIAYKQQTTTYIHNQPQEVDPGMTAITYDTLCNGAISPYTPANDTQDGYVFTPISFIPGDRDINDIRKRRQEGKELTGGQLKSGDISYNYPHIFIEAPTEPCPDRIPKEDESITIDFLRDANQFSRETAIRFTSQGDRAIQNITVHIADTLVATKTYDNPATSVSDVFTFTIPESIGDGEHVMKVSAVDIAGYSNYILQPVNIVSNDNTPPKLLENRTDIRQNADGTYRVVLLFEDDLSSIVGGSLSINGTTYEFSNNIASITINELGILSYTVSDSYRNTTNDEIDLRE